MLNPEIQKRTIIRRRSVLLTGGKMLALSILGGRLYFLQVKEKSKYRNLSEGNRIKIIPLMPRRGVIKDRNGKMLAEGLPRYQLLFNPPKNVSAEDSFLKIAKLVNIPKARQDEIISKISNPKTRYPILLENFMAWESIAKVKTKSRDLQGAKVHFIESRIYPFANITSHLTGYIGKISSYSDENKKKFGNLIKHPDLRIGKTGVEKSMQDELVGKPGIAEVEVDSRGRQIKELAFTNQSRGDNLRLTIDVDMQNYTRETLLGKGGIKTEGASAVLMDVENGDIISMVSVPDYDPNAFIRGITNKELQEIYKNPDKPLLNKAISNRYPPGSTFKSVVAIAALEEGLIHRNSFVFCTGGVELGDRTFKCWKEEGHGHVNLDEAIAQSCNVYFYETARILGIKKIAKYAKMFGLGVSTGIQLPGEIKGIVPDPAWKMRNLKQSWYEGETLNTGIGQGYLAATPLQLAVMASRIASGGREVEPRIVVEPKDDSNRKFPFMKGVSGKNIQVVQSGMVKVVNSLTGTARGSKINIDEYRFAGKTGTSQVTEAKRIKKRKAGFEENHSVFIGYAPIYKPKYAVSVVVEYGGGGSKAAAPIARDILLYAQQKFKS